MKKFIIAAVAVSSLGTACAVDSLIDPEQNRMESFNFPPFSPIEKCHCHNQGATGATGSNGIPGATGAPGVTGEVNFAHYFNNNDVQNSLTSDQAIFFGVPATGILFGSSIIPGATGTVFNLSQVGDYLVSAIIQTDLASTATVTIEAQINGEVQLPAPATSYQTGTVIAGDQVTLQEIIPITSAGTNNLTINLVTSSAIIDAASITIIQLSTTAGIIGNP